MDAFQFGLLANHECCVDQKNQHRRKKTQELLHGVRRCIPFMSKTQVGPFIQTNIHDQPKSVDKIERCRIVILVLFKIA